MNRISYSQLKRYLQCPKAWENKYIHKIELFNDSIYTVFGNAMHTVVEEWVRTIYNESAKKANELDLNAMLKENLKIEYLKAKKENNNEAFLSAKELFEFYEDGVATLDYLKKKRSRYFPKKHTKLMGIEIELNTPVNDNIKFNGFIDIVLKDTLRNKIIVIDLKTSTRSWGDYKKKDDLVRMQLLFYKHYYAEQFNVNVDDVEIFFLILKRKLYENSDFPQPRTQTFVPPNSKRTIKKYLKILDEFINECFDKNGDYVRKNYEASGNANACKWCEYRNTEHCPE